MKISKNRVNFWLGTLMFADMLFLSLIALIMKYILPPGCGSRHRGWGEGEPLTFLGLGRHDWGDVHWVLALILLSMLVVHLLLHWKWIVHQIKCTFEKAGDSEACEAETPD